MEIESDEYHCTEFAVSSVMFNFVILTVGMAGAGAFSQLLLGTYELPQLARRQDIRVNGNTRELSAVFHKKPVLITDYF